MPVSVVVGGQFGSEGKGKVAHFLAGEMSAAAAVRVGGPNSGHTVVGPAGESLIFRQLPTAAILPGVQCIVPSGAYLDVDVLLSEIRAARLPEERLFIDPNAVVITEDEKESESRARLRERIGSTLSGTGAAVGKRIARDPTLLLARDEPRLKKYLRPVIPELRDLLTEGKRIIVEGTQGFGLSVLHGEYPSVTSRDTTAAAFVAESGLSPLDVDDVVLVIRAFPIRVPGNSGDLKDEIDWQTITKESGSSKRVVEYTSVTKGLRRVGRFDPEIVRRAILANQPSRVILNHLDYVDAEVATTRRPGERVVAFVEEVSSSIGRRIDYLGMSAALLLPAEERMAGRWLDDR
jgi:adenylosuccinate synthase